TTRTAGPAVTTASIAQLLASATTRDPLATGDGKSDARLERIVVEGQTLVVKHVDLRADWLARASGERRCRHMLLWRSGVLDELPSCLDHATVGCAEDTARGTATVLLRDVSPWLVPPGPLSQAQHRRFLDHMAAMHARFWGHPERAGLLPMSRRYLVLSPQTAAAERARGGEHPVPARQIPQGWRRLPVAAPRSAALAAELVADPTPLLAALARTPSTLLHGDWKVANLGTRPDGRTVLLDWSLAGVGPPCADLAWYLAVNAAALPEPREDAIEAYRRSLERHGVDTGKWWQAQLGLCLIGAFLLLGWDKTIGDPAEIGWWDDRVADAARLLA
ncbi:MAG: phosphotransferase, partial [Actinomycetia bacterium]|nr:phosphotransferase [Actinomycetes bacterium]